MEPETRSTAIQEGMALPILKKGIRQEQINRYAKASRDFNPIHIDEEFARKTPLGGTVAHGMLILAYVSEMMTVAFGMDWITTGRLNVRFKSPARPGDIVTVSGVVRRVEDWEGLQTIYCDVLCQNQRGETIIAGEASATVNPCQFPEK